jgi:hypothetical protein
MAATGKTAEQDAQDRKQAQARKKRGTGGHKKEQQQWLGGFSLSQIAHKNQYAAQRREERNQQIEQKVEAVKTQMEKLGTYFLSIDTHGFSEIVRSLKNHYHNSNVRWRMVDTGFMLAKEQKA